MDPAALADAHPTLGAAARAYTAHLLDQFATPFSPCAPAPPPDPPAWAPEVPPGSLADLLTDGPLQHVPDPLLRRDLVADGLAVPFLAEVVRSPLLPDGAAARGAAALLQLGARAGWAVVAGTTAWWVHTGRGAPETVHVHAPSRHRGPDWLDIAQCRWCAADGTLADEVERVGGCAVTSPALTAADLLRTAAPGSRDAVALLLGAGLVTVAEVESVLDRQPGFAGTRRARGTLRLAATSGTADAVAPGAQETVPWTVTPSAVTR
jgi:hypothetical protein